MTQQLPTLRYGIVGLGNASRLLLPSFAGQETAILAAAADLRPDARAAFTAQYGAPAFPDLAAMLDGADLDVVWVATPNPVHAEHAVMAAERGKHVVCEKPIATTLADCDRMIAAVAASGVRFLQGQCKLFQPPVRAMREIIAGGSLGNIVQITTINFNDWLQRPRLAAEVDTDQAGGICYRQAPHQADIVRYLAGTSATSVRTVANRADPNFPTEGNYTTLLTFEGGVAASLVYNAYGFFDISELTWNIGEGGREQTPVDQRPARPRLTGPVTPDELYATGRLRRSDGRRHQPIYGLTIIACERGVIRQSPDGIFIYDETGRREIACGANSAAGHEFTEIAQALTDDRPAFPDAHWGRATLEVCLAMLESSAKGTEIVLRFQTAAA